MYDIEMVKQSRLFAGIGVDELSSMLSCLNARDVEAAKGELLLRAGEPVEQVGILLEGNLSVTREDADGERSLIALLEPGDHFAEAFCCAGVEESPVTVAAESDSVVLLLDFRRILHTCTSACSFHAKLIENMLFVVASKNIYLQTRMDYLSRKTLRRRIMKYLVNTSGGSKQVFDIPFNREALADYLCIDRSALSRELARMKEDGLIDYWKNRFKVN